MPAAYSVERVLAKKISPKGKTYYLIKWENWPESQSTWEPAQHLENCREVLLQFEKKPPLENKSKLIQSIATPWASSRNPSKKKKKIVKKKQEQKPKILQEKRQEVQETIKEQNQYVYELPQSENERIENGRVRIQQSDSNNSRGISKQYTPLLEVIGMKEKEEDKDFKFFVKYRHDSQGIYELDHWTLFIEYPRELCIFYEKNITIDDKHA